MMHFSEISGLSRLLSAVRSVPEAIQTKPISLVTSDSRKATNNSLFVAIDGSLTDGHQYITSAIQLGAKAIVVLTERVSTLDLTRIPDDVAVYQADDTYKALGALCDVFYGKPASQLGLVGVTGTNGKTTVTHLIEDMIVHWGKSVGLIGTLGKRSSDKTADKQATDNKDADSFQSTGHTTPMAPELHALMRSLVDEGTEYLVMEVSSHALEQHRTYGCDFNVAIHTNVTQDHLDYHHTMSRYAQAKSLLFSGLNPSIGAKAVINLDDQWAQTMLDACPEGVEVLTFGLVNEQAQYRAMDAVYHIHQTQFTLHTPEGTFPMTVKLAGQFGIYNTLAAIAGGVALGIPLAVCLDSIQAISGIRGRFEVVSQSPSVIVDYAHTPDGLENVLSAAKNITPEGSRLIAVFGCGGDRDATKRPQMGGIAERYADVLVVTSDNPRTEDPQQILADVVRGIRQFDPARMSVIEDRRVAIRHAIDGASPTDVVVVAGKGHEDYQILATETIHFDDREEVQRYMAEKQSCVPK